LNDTTENIEATARFVKTLGDSVAIELLPYHRFGTAKYRTLDRSYPGEAFTTPSPEQLEAARRIFETHGVACSLGG
jgi:pyruvate formate lyase activating enzyme